MIADKTMTLNYQAASSTMKQIVLKLASLFLRWSPIYALVTIVATMGLAGAAELTILDFVTVKFGSDAQLVARDKLVVGKGVVLTSQQDDRVGGQTNPTAQTPVSGSWRGLRVEKTASSSGMTLTETTIRYAGAQDGAGLTVRGFNPSLQYVQFADNTIGLRVNGASPAISGSSFMRNGIGLEADGNAAPTITNTQFAQNTSQAILNKTPATIIQATSDWWGHTSGPKDAIGNPQGQGDAVSTGVNYGQFLTLEPLINATVRLTIPATYYEQSTISLDIACVNASEYRIAEGGAFSGVSFLGLSDGRGTVPFVVSSGDGRKAVSVQFRNASGNIVTAALNGGLLIDTQGPTLNITNPAAGSVLSKPITVEASASDGSGVARVEFYLDGQLQRTVTVAPYTFAWNTDTSLDGAHAIRVVAVDVAGRSTEETRSVTLTRLPPPPDTDGPALTNLRIGGLALLDGATLARSGTVTVDASDRSGIARVELLLDGAVVATATGSSTYSAVLNLDNVANGSHTVALKAADSLNNISTATVTVSVTHAVPAAPVITQPAPGLTTRIESLAVSGTAQAASQVQLYLGGNPVGAPVVAGADGRFATNVTLVSGSNQIQAKATDQYGTSPYSGMIAVTLDTNVPVSPTNLVALAQAGGKIKLSWTRSTDPNATGYFIYRATSGFTATGEAIKLNGSAIAVTSYDDAPAPDGTYYYRVVAVNNAGTPSLPTNLAQTVADATLPKALSIAYTPLGKVDAATGRIGQGRVDVVVTVSEALQAAPYLSIVPEGGQPIPVDLIRTTDTQYSGSFVIDSSTPSGTANALFSARDLLGNRGTEISAGATLKIDTAGPVLTGITLTPASPIKNDTAQTVAATFTLSKALKTGETPQIAYLLSGPVRSAVALTGLTKVNATTWSGSFTLPQDAGLGGPETVLFTYRGIDDLDNVSTQVTAFNRFQVYQGALPPLAVPLGLTAKAQPGGKVALAWQPVTDAFAYQIYRQGPGETALAAYQRAAGASYIDQTTQDGAYQYAVATIRQSNGQESLSVQSSPVQVTASGTAPGAPQNLALQLTGQGIWATWQPPLASQVDSYNLYRASGTGITSLQGLTPIKTGIKQAAAMDANPSPTDHAYVATALDAAGNESALSNSAYLNAGLLPVATLRVDQIGNDLPVLTWAASRSNVAGYNVYVGPDNGKIKLTSTPTTSLTLTDSGYTAGERRYTVAAVDANNVEMARAIVLPAVSAQVVSGLPVKRGVMNRLQVQVANTSATAIDNASVVVRVANKDHKSGAFSLGANETRLIPVIVGGYADLLGQAQAQVGVEIVPNEGEFVKIARNATFDVIDSALIVGIATEEFTRGGVGKVRLTIENTSDVEVELLTARNNGVDASDELRFKILDADGNVLATQAYKQVFGASVITLGTGRTVARIGAGANYTSDLFSLNVPASSPDSIRVRLEVDKLRYHTGQPDEVVITGRGSEKTVTLMDTAYLGEVTDVTPVSSYGDQDIVITGRALDRQTSAVLPNTQLKLVLNQQGFERSYTVLTGATGSFTYTFKPTLTDAGLYKVSAVHPDITDRPEQKAFTINRVTVNPTTYNLNVARNYVFTIPFKATAGAGTAASNLRFVLDAAAQPTGQLPAGVTAQLPAPITIGERQTLNLPVVFSADNTAQPSGSLVLNVLSDEHPNTPIGQVKINYTLSEAKPYLVATPSLVETGMTQGGSAVESVLLENKGLQDALDLQIGLTNTDGSPAPAWVAIASSASPETLAVGGKRNIDLSFTPSTSTAEGVHQFKLTVKGANVPEQGMNVFASVTQSGIGNVLFKASDIYTATVDKYGRLIPGLVGATITVQNEDVISVMQELVTDSLGEAYFQNLPAGRYKFKAKAANHQEIAGRFQIKPGVTFNQSVFLDYNLVTVEWTVREVTIQDRYEITLNATFETNVPAAVVMMQPTSTNLPAMKAGDVYYGELSLTNYGLVRADNLKQRLPQSDAFFKYEFLVDPPTSLEAKAKVTIPYRIVSLLSLDGSGTASGGGCYSYSNSMGVSYDYRCANGSTSGGSTSTTWFSASNSTCSSGTSSTTSSGGGGTGGGWYGFGGGSVGYTDVPGLPPCVDCSGQCCKDGGAGSGGAK
jgi:fibronectin type 3 domain-containing protein